MTTYARIPVRSLAFTHDVPTSPWQGAGVDQERTVFCWAAAPGWRYSFTREIKYQTYFLRQIVSTRSFYRPRDSSRTHQIRKARNRTNRKNVDIDRGSFQSNLANVIRWSQSLQVGGPITSTTCLLSNFNRRHAIIGEPKRKSSNFKKLYRFDDSTVAIQLGSRPGCWFL